MVKVAAFLPANDMQKCMKILAGKPLYLYNLEKLIKCNNIDEVYLCSESNHILDYADYLDYNKCKKNNIFSSSDNVDKIREKIHRIDTDIFAQISYEKPFINIETIQKCIDHILNNENCDCVTLVRSKEQTFSMNKYNQTYDMQNLIEMSAGFFAIRSSTICNNNICINGSIHLIPCNATEDIEVKFQNDFDLADTVMTGIRHKEVTTMRLLSNHLTSSAISDVLKEYSINSTIGGLKPNISGKKILGRANTLKIRHLNVEEDDVRIYDALNTYSLVKEGDIIIVDTDVPERAYFGDLNANLAIRSGAIATVVNGVTRDTKKVKDLDYPVYAAGSCCNDIKYEGAIESHNKPICIQNVMIYPDDLVFCDEEGIVIIPKYLETEVIKKVLSVISNEHKIISKILSGFSPEDIINSCGFF